MKHINVIIEMSSEGRYSCYMDNGDDLDYAIIGTGATSEEAREDFDACYYEMRTHYAKENKPFEEISYSFSYDYGSILAFYEGKLSLDGLHRITGVPAERLRNYVSGGKRPTQSTIDKIFASLRSFGLTMSTAAML